MILLINFEVLKKENIEIFKSCDWNGTVVKKINLNFGNQFQKKQYKIWNAPFIGPLTWFSPFKHSGECFSKFFQLNLDFKKPLKDSLLKTKGY